MNQCDQQLYTIILEFEGTTSIAQEEAMGPDEALNQWFKGLADKDSYGLTAAQSQALLATSCPDPFETVEVTGVRSVWCATALASDNLALFTIVKTLSNVAL
jgi:hypothetical protein